MQRLAICCVLAAIAAFGAGSRGASAAEVTIDDPFEKAGYELNYKEGDLGERVNGTMADGWTDNTSWNKEVVAKFSMEKDAGKSYFKIHVSKSKIQIHTNSDLRDVSDAYTYKISVTARRGDGGRISAGLRYMSEPYDHLWASDIPLERAWKTVEREFVPKTATRQVRLFLYLEGTIELDHIKLERSPLKPPRGDASYYIRPGDTVLALGDAITSSGGYLRLVFEDDLQRKYPDLARGGGKVRLVNAGRNGATADGIMEEAVRLADEHSPDVILLCFGANDFYVSPHSFGSNMRRLVMKLKSPNRSITILSPPYFYTKGYPELEPRVASLEAMVREIKSLVVTEGATFADCFSAMKDRMQEGVEDFSWGDGIRPNSKGDRMMADALQKAWNYGDALYRDK